MLYHCVQAGMDMAIVNAAQITPYAEIPAQERELAEDLILNRRPDALQRFIEYFENVTPAAAGSALADPTEGMSAEERLHWRILHRHKEGVEADIDSLVPYPLSPAEGKGDKG
jgi:5-methyltetrahydrofolate--homocysteine methyltransferase